MLELLNKFDYSPPRIVTGKFGEVEITLADNHYYLTVNGEQWMAYNSKGHDEVFQVFSHYYFAKGHTVVTGMGFGARENWILTKPEVTKLTIIERTEDLLNYHKEIDSPFLKDPRVEIVIDDARNYRGACDVLLLDHYELEEYDWILNDVREIQDRNVCKTLWFYPFERIIMHCRKWHSDNEFSYLITKHQAMQIVKHNHGLHRIPYISEETLNMFCMMHHALLFTKSEYFLNKYFPDRKVYHEIYKCF